MENLLAFRTGRSYIGKKDGEPIPVDLDKASVFPESSFADILGKYRLLKKTYPDLAIVRLVVAEEPFYKE